MRVHQSIIILGALCGLATLVPAQSEREAVPSENQQEWEQWREALGADDFETRESAMADLWEMGNQAEELLTELEAVDDPEVRARAGLLLRKIRLGITPGTPKRVERLLVAYLVARPTDRIAILGKLKDEEAYEYILRLWVGETDRVALRALENLIDDIMPPMVAEFLQEKRVEKAKEVLALSNRFEHLIRLGHLLQIDGELEAEIARLRPSEERNDQERYLAYLRVKGDAGLLRAEAARLGDRELEIQAAVAEGDFRPYFTDLAGRPQVGEATRNYLRWVLAEDQGNREEMKELEAEMLKSAAIATAEPTAKINLFRIGRGDQVIANLPEQRYGTRVRYHLQQENYPLVEELLELPAAGEFDDWLQKWGKRSRAELGTRPPHPVRDRLVIATGFLEGRGRVSEAEKCAEALFDLTRDRDTGEVEELLSNLYFYAPKAVMGALAREIEEFERGVSELFDKLPSARRSQSWLYHLLAEEAPEMSTRERLLMSFSFSSRYPLVEAEKYNEFFERIFQRCLKSDDKENDLDNLLSLIMSRNRGEEISRIYEAKEATSVNEKYNRAFLALDRGKLTEAGERLKDLLGEQEGMSPVLRYQVGLVLAEAGLEDGEELREEALQATDGSASSLAALSSHHLQLGDQEKAYQLLKRGFLRLPSMPEPGKYSPGLVFVRNLASDAAALRRWKEAHAFRQIYALLGSYSGVVEGGIYYTRYRFEILVARGALAMEQGEIEKAVAAFGEAHRILPHDGYLANELFPVMREVGLGEYHDQLFAESARFAREMVRLYPEDDNIYNNFAWMASRANRCLDEAERYLNIALEMNPQSAAYLDTMGEIHFARRNRAEAVKWSNLSLENATFGNGDRWELHLQNKRFKTDPFPPK